MSPIKVAALLLCVAVTKALPLSRVHVKFVSAPHVYEHDLTTHGGQTISQKSYLSIGRRNVAESQRHFGDRLNEPQLQRFDRTRQAIVIAPENAESLWPVGVFLPPVDVNDLGYGSRELRHMTPDFSNGLEHPDPLLLTGEAASLAVNYIYGRGELFYDDFPHVRAIIRNQEERRQNGLHDHVLSSLRADSPWVRKGKL